jgi:hypothetical protein
MQFPFGETVTVRRMVKTGARDEYGVAVRQPVDTTYTNCATWSGPSTERNDNQTQVIADRTVVLPHGTAVEATDVVVVQGKSYNVQGQPSDDTSPFTGWAPGVIVELRRVGG